MSKSLAELRQSPHVGLPEKLYPICLAGKLQAEYDLLQSEYELIEDDPKGGRVGARSPRRKLEDQLEALREQMHEHLVPVLFRAKPGHEWREFVGARPPREDERLDEITGFNVDKVIQDLPEFIVTVSDKPLEPGDWEFVRANAADGDLKECVSIVIALHNRPVDIPKSRLNLRLNQEKQDD